jgi:hypothetical protein
MESTKPERLKIYVQGVLVIKVRNGAEGQPLLARVGDTSKKVLVGAEAEELLSRLATDPTALWHCLEVNEGLRERCKDALAAYERLIL